MKKHRIQPTPRRPQPHRPATALRTQTVQRRLYTDFLALCLYPGMRPPAPGTDRSRAA